MDKDERTGVTEINDIAICFSSLVIVSKRMFLFSYCLCFTYQRSHLIIVTRYQGQFVFLLIVLTRNDFCFLLFIYKKKSVPVEKQKQRKFHVQCDADWGSMLLASVIS